MAELFQDIASAVYNGEADTVGTLVTRGVDEGFDAQDLLSNGLIAGMDEVGKDFKAGELFVPEVLIAARAMHAGMDVLRPLLAESGVPTAGKVLIGTVQGDLHDIGKNLVRMMLEGAGYEMIDMGTDVNAEDVVASVREHQPQVLGLSALLTTTMVNMKATIEALDEAGVRDSVKIVIGGAPVTSAYADEIGADGYAPDAASAVDLVRELTG